MVVPTFWSGGVLEISVAFLRLKLIIFERSRNFLFFSGHFLTLVTHFHHQTHFFVHFSFIWPNFLITGLVFRWGTFYFPLTLSPKDQDNTLSKSSRHFKIFRSTFNFCRPLQNLKPHSTPLKLHNPSVTLIYIKVTEFERVGVSGCIYI